MEFRLLEFEAVSETPEEHKASIGAMR